MDSLSLASPIVNQLASPIFEPLVPPGFEPLVPPKIKKNVQFFEADNAKADNTKADNTEADNTEADDAEADNTEADNAEEDNAEADNAKADNTEADNAKADDAEADNTEADNAKADNTEADNAEADNAEEDNAEADNAEADNAEADNAEEDNTNNLKKINLPLSLLLNKIINDKISINNSDDNSIHLIFSDGFIQKINNGQLKKILLLSMKNGKPNMFFKEWEFTTFINSSHQTLLKEDKPFSIIESIYLYCPNNKFSHDLLCKKYKLNNRSNIILVIDLYEITQKKLFNTFGLEYLNSLSFDDIISNYHKLSKEIKTLFNDFYSIDCPNCGCITSINFMRIFPKTITFCKCAKCRHLIAK